jgi:hypothetical protein
MLWSQFYKHNPIPIYKLHIVLLQKHGRIDTLDCYGSPLFGLNDCFKMCECFKDGYGISRKMIKELGRCDGRVCQEYG